MRMPTLSGLSENCIWILDLKARDRSVNVGLVALQKLRAKNVTANELIQPSVELSNESYERKKSPSYVWLKSLQKMLYNWYCCRRGFHRWQTFIFSYNVIKIAHTRHHQETLHVQPQMEWKTHFPSANALHTFAQRWLCADTLCLVAVFTPSIRDWMQVRQPRYTCQTFAPFMCLYIYICWVVK